MKTVLRNFSAEAKQELSLIEDTDHIGSLYRKIRTRLRLSQADVGKIINIDRNVVGKIEKGKRDLRFEEVLELSKYNKAFRFGAIAFLEEA